LCQLVIPLRYLEVDLLGLLSLFSLATFRHFAFNLLLDRVQFFRKLAAPFDQYKFDATFVACFTDSGEEICVCDASVVSYLFLQHDVTFEEGLLLL
tara:strand:+ start:6889 stop:7176 length:288 start_codon:yes stop_codon:yes gene_type:complete